MNKIMSLWAKVSPQWQYEIKSILRTFVAAFLSGLVVEIQSGHALTRAVIFGLISAGVRAASKVILPQESAKPMV